MLANGQKLEFERDGKDVYITLPNELPDSHVNVIALTYDGEINAIESTIVSQNFSAMTLEVEDMDEGDATIDKTSTMHYFGDWKHDFTLGNLSSNNNSAVWKLRVLEPGAYKVSLNYSASEDQAGQEGVLKIKGDDYFFKVLETGKAPSGEGFAPRTPLIFIDHPVCLLYTSPSPRDLSTSRMTSSA